MARTAIAFGTFDKFHPGHASYLRQARRQAERLVVVVARDRNVEKTKGKIPRDKEAQRLQNVRACEACDLAVLGSLDDRYRAIAEERPEIICLGYDQQADIAELKRALKELGLAKTTIKRMRPYYPGKYKSSLL